MKRIWGVVAVLGLTAPAQETPVFRTDTRLVEVQVVVTGRGGAPVAGLTEDDFTVLENGKRQKIAFFAAPAARAAVEEAPGALPTGVFTNRPEYAPGRPKGVTAVVLDVLNTKPPWEAQYFARAALARFLRSLQDDELVGVYVLGNGIRVVHDFSDDPASLARMVKGLRNEWPAGSAGQADAMRAQAELLAQVAGAAGLQQALGPVADLEMIETETRVRMTLEQLEMIAEHMAGVPGRKSLVWLSEGMPILIVTMSPAGIPYYHKLTSRYERAVNRLAEANVAVYPVDARGLRLGSDTPMFQPDLGVAGGPLSRAQWGREMLWVPARETFASMQFLAEATGGRAFYNANDLETGMRRAVEDLKANYTLAYYTSLRDEDRKRALEVKVKRRGVEVLARRYVPAGRREALVEVKDLLESPVAASGVLLNGRVTRAGDRLRVLLEIEPGSLLWNRNGGRTEAVVEVYVAQIRPSGERVVADTRLELRLTEEEVRKVSAEGLVYERELPWDEEMGRVRVVVRDGRSGAAGTLDAPVRRIPMQ